MWIRLTIATAACGVLLGGLAGCGLVEDPRPTSARARLTSSEGEPVALIASKVFLVQFRETLTGTERIITILDADTTLVTSSFDRSFNIERDLRFLVRVPVPDTLRGELRLQAWIDGEARYNRLAAEEDTILQFIYVYEGGNPPPDDDNL